MNTVEYSFYAMSINDMNVDDDECDVTRIQKWSKDKFKKVPLLTASTHELQRLSIVCSSDVAVHARTHIL